MTHIHLSAIIVVALMIALPDWLHLQQCRTPSQRHQSLRVSRRKMAVFKFNQASELCVPNRKYVYENN